MEAPHDPVRARLTEFLFKEQTPDDCAERQRDQGWKKQLQRQDQLPALQKLDKMLRPTQSKAPKRHFCTV
ncbi:hypothetical protein COW36_05960 [bacterium (Candidatus Blackallbacteria) CG17_big_fil_post_rev_8_21_14_2_50_48_46]|uniref:Uncharacterized protein n=1 Tax=bacterium (Candidatus Blackallbacteria) CG17_big_fil_post_rev_8_21_14_2_50_48_46 TaxID=2014261 RepID=A0A2M7G906_9BACT|nr:MAG: hypothetical protein COW64_21555 [bacterium (Candidatus Blackallbacteria) CG18_big_fil_WC_8_21_14_2_50_49_26]PIW18311.1 MAG: hypothetical protein COW36_05960 [bacterium (Candidatus Blackallbacteria) CG17_big_fil_post_rev_8_21_14_2_50_48_46]PIW49535.1 MAG: hypothetical protein COW20_05775 [bacterium (Candidatus Blackallbacteria) CG13_big_fil_rev_8_21_14_2_50_49_14]